MQRLIQRLQSSTPTRRRRRQQQQQQLHFEENFDVDGDTVSCSSFSSLDDESTTELDQALALSLQEQQDEEDLRLAYRMSLLDNDNHSYVMVNDQHTQQQQHTSASLSTTSTGSMEPLDPLLSMMSVAAIEEEGQELILHSVPPLTAASSSSSSSAVPLRMACFRLSDDLEKSSDDDEDHHEPELCYDCLVQANLRFFQLALGSPEQQTTPVSELCESCRVRSETAQRAPLKHDKYIEDCKPKAVVLSQQQKQGSKVPGAANSCPSKMLRFETTPSTTRNGSGSGSRRQHKTITASRSAPPRITTTANIVIKPKTGGIYRKLRSRRLGGGSSLISGDGNRRPNLFDQRAPLALYMYGDEDVLSPFDCLLRKNLQYYEYFEEGSSNGQVGIRCCNCSHLTSSGGGSGSSGAFPIRLSDIHTVARQIAKTHLMTSCCPVGKNNRVGAELTRLFEEEQLSTSSSNIYYTDQHYWAETAKASGVFEIEDGLGWTAFLPGEGDTRRRFVHKQFSKTMRSGAKSRSSGNAIRAA